MMDYTLIRSKRKTVAIYIKGRSVEIRAPLRMPKSDINKFVAAKENWIADKLAASSDQAARRECFSLEYGDSVTYRGRQYPIIAKDGSRIGFDSVNFYMPPDLTTEQIKSACVQIYRKLAKRDLAERIAGFAERMSVVPAAIKINGAKTRWGSCSAKKNLNFSWRLMMAGDDVIDYVVVHELAHITEMNHSKKFWAVVESILPDYRERRLKLKVLQQKLNTENWE
jgi:predicted metal-dependent hydrolase